MLLGPDIETGAIRSCVESRFDAVATQVIDDGYAFVFGELLERRQDLAIVLSGRVPAIIRYLPPAPEGVVSDKSAVSRIADFTLLEFEVREQPGSIFRVFPRRRAYTERHLIMAGPGEQRHHLASLVAALRMMKGLGVGYSAIFNAAAPTSPTYHHQILGAPLPLWTNLETGRVVVEEERSAEVPGVVMGELGGWPFRSIVLDADDPTALAAAVGSCIDRQALAFPGMKADLLITCAADRRLKVAVVLRRPGHLRPLDFYAQRPDAIGTFGGMELSGMMVTLKDETVFRELVADPALAARRFERGLVETTRSIPKDGVPAADHDD